MVKREEIEPMEIAVEQLSYVPGVPVDRFHTARRWWAAAQRTAQSAADYRATSTVSSASGAISTITTAGTTFRRLVDVPGTRLGPVLHTWWRHSSHDDGHLRLDRLGCDRGLFELDGSLRTSALSLRIPVEVRLSPYAACWSLLELTPRRPTRPSRVYFRIGHESLDRFVAGLAALV